MSKYYFQYKIFSENSLKTDSKPAHRRLSSELNNLNKLKTQGPTIIGPAIIVFHMR